MVILAIFEKIAFLLDTDYSFKIYKNTSLLPVEWNSLAIDNIFLRREYLEVLEKSSPVNMICHFIGIFDTSKLIGIVITQFLFAENLQSFGDRDQCFKTSVRNFAFKNFASHVLFVGNNMLTGQNAFIFDQNAHKIKALKTLHKAINHLKKDFKASGKKIHITSLKDFTASEIEPLQSEFKNNFTFSTQPNMVFDIKDNWKVEKDYVEALSKKYRDQYKRARKKAEDIVKQKMSLSDIIKHEDTIYNLYFHVAKNAPFNTFFLAKNHFTVFKELMKDDFLMYGYFLDGKMIGFNTLIKNGKVMDTYFLGYDEGLQREKMLYLNMLYDMIGYSIKKGFKQIIFARTALEIKSSVGAKPVNMFGLLTHSNALINRNIAYFFNYLEPKTQWQERNPFK